MAFPGVDPVCVRVCLLGPVNVTVGGKVRPVPGLRRKAVLSALALRAGRVIGVDRLIDVVWDGKPPATATNALQSHVSYLRRLVEAPGAIVARAPGYVLDLGVRATDVDESEALIEQGKSAADPAQRVSGLRAALELWRGPPLADVTGLSWFGEQASRLERVRRGAEQALVEARLELGQHAELVPELEGMAGPYPFDEELHGLLMVALYRSGRQADALAVFRRLRGQLREELGIDPSVPLRELETAILRQDPSLDPVPAAQVADLGLGSADSVPVLPKLVERAGEMSLVDQALDRAVAGREGSLLVVEGPAGIGKTSLLAYARVRAETLGFRVATARGTDLEVDNAWGCVRQLFERFTRSPDAPASAVSRLAEAGPAAPQGEYPIINSLFWLASDLASRNPLLIIVDDMHRADSSSAQFLAYLAARLDALSAVVIIALRPGAGRLKRITSVIADLPLAVTATLSPLTPAGCAELLNLADAPGGEELTLRCHDATNGNPFLVLELGRQLSSQASEPAALRESPNIARFVEGQLRHLPAHARSVAHALAVLGDGTGGRALGQVAGISSREALDAASSLVANELAGSSGVPPRFFFRHPLIRSAVYDGIKPSTLIDLHLRAVRGAMADHDPIRAASHLLRVPAGMGDRDSAAILGQAADLSLARGSVDGAVAFLRRNLDEDLGDQRLSVLTRLGMTEALVNMPQAIERLSHALALEPDPEQRAEIAFILATTMWMTGRPRKAAVVCQGALDRERQLSHSARQALQSCIGMVAYGTPHSADLVSLLDGYSSQPTDSSAGGLMLEASLALNDAMKNRRQSAERRARRVLANDHLAGQPLAVTLLTCAWYALVPCDSPQLLPSVEAALEYSRKAGSLRGIAPAFMYRSICMLARGHLDEAVHDGRLAVEASRNSGLGLGLVFIADRLIAALLARGDVDEAQSILNQAKAAHGPALNRHIYANGETNLLLAQGNIRGALEMAQSTRDYCQTMGVSNPEIFDWRGPLVRCLEPLGRHEEAHAISEDLLSAAAAWGTPRAIGKALRGAAVVATSQHKLDMLAESVRLLEGTDARLEHAISRYALGEALLRADRFPDAQSHLRKALELAGFCGARPLRRSVLTALREAGGQAAPKIST